MTQNEIRYWELQEAKRSNQVRENETERANRAKEVETNRANLAKEREENRSSVAREAENFRSNTAREVETNRANLASEKLKKQIQDSQIYQNSVKNWEIGTQAVKNATGSLKDIASLISGGVEFLNMLTGG